MTTKLTKFTQIFSTLMVAITLVFTPVFTQAATVSSDYKPQSLQEMIAYLYGIIAQLQAQLDAQNGVSRTPVNSSSDGVGVARPGSVSSSDIEVETLSATNIDVYEVDLRGRIDLNSRSYAYVWFEYGEDKDMDDTTTKRKITDSRSGWQSFSTNIDNLQDDQKYYFRVVGEDSRGDRDYGSIRSFTTDDRSGNSSSNSNNSSGNYNLSVSDTSVAKGDTVEVSWSVPSNENSPSNWIGLYKKGVTNSSYLSYRYLSNSDKGTIQFTLNSAGEYEFRLFIKNSYNEVETSQRVTVN
ncbi:hypothetical protein H6784_00030 [Candidatus Nomurabacteria bacterium]|nr:hypothetical protein [Candidatus Kaiserbacteria bacterium]MCB9813780.1 hypothetical protein [Candidatus Nomurabacteria bacterium]